MATVMGMIRILSLFTLVTASLLLAACPKSHRSKIPKSAATPEEQQQIDLALVKISDLTEKFGKRLEFKRIPIIVTVGQTVGRPAGTCVGKSYITIDRGVIRDHWWTSGLAPLLLHEIGHCYFGRGHDDTMITKAGYQMAINEYKSDPVHPQMHIQVMDGICATVMCSNGQSPGQLLEYYVGEFLGQPPATTVEDLQKFTDIKLTPAH